LTRLEKILIETKKQVSIDLPKSKSESIRLLMIYGLAELQLDSERLSESNDTVVFRNLLLQKTNNGEDAGTPYRFYLAFCCLRNIQKTIDCYEGLKKRPIKDLVDALRQLGAKITYTEKEGFPPLRIEEGIDKSKKSVNIKSDISSQYLSAILLIAPYFENGLHIYVEGVAVSKPYIDITLNLMHRYGIQYQKIEETIEVKKGQYRASETFMAESDWSSAAFFYAACAVNQKVSYFFNKLNIKSLQADTITIAYFRHFGVNTIENDKGITIEYDAELYGIQPLAFDVKNCPDMFPALCATVIALGKKAIFINTENLRLKECDRILAMQENTATLKIDFIKENNNIVVDATNVEFPDCLSIKSFDDHRIVMACSLFAYKTTVAIDDGEAVKKSFPEYWKEFEKNG